MSAAGGFPDWQRITQWFGNSVAEEAGHVLDAGNLVVGPLNVRSFASIVVWVKAIGGAVTVTVTEQVPDGPASLQTQSSFVVAAGNVIAEAFVLLAGEATVTFQGGAVGTSIDYAIVPANTNVNAEVAALTQLGFQHNDAVVANETAIDLEDSLTLLWTLLDDPANLRMKVTPLVQSMAPLAVVSGAASIAFASIPQTFRNLLVLARIRCVGAVGQDTALIRFNVDVVGPYDSEAVNAAGAAASGAEAFGLGYMPPVIMPGANAPAGSYADVVLLILDYANAATRKAMIGLNGWKNADLSGSIGLRALWGERRVNGAVTRLDIGGNGSVLDTGSRGALYGFG